VDANIDCMAGLIAVIDPDTFVRVNWVKSCCRDDKLVAVAAAEVAAPLVCTGDIRFGVRLEEALVGKQPGLTDWLDVLVGGWDSSRGSVVASETVADPVVGVNLGSGVYGVVTFGPEVSDVGVLSAGEMSISWLGRS